MEVAAPAMHALRRVLYPAAEGQPDGLVPEAHAQQRHGCPRRLAHQGHADAGILRTAGPGRQHDGRRLGGDDIAGAASVVAHDRGVRTELSEVLHEVEGERVVVVDHHDAAAQPACERAHRLLTRAIASTAAASLLSISRASSSGVESATIPAAACRYARPSTTTTLRRAIAVSSTPPLPMYPTAPAYGPRPWRSRPAMISMARIFGPPVTVPAGKHARRASSAVRPGASRARMPLARCITRA